MWYDIVLNLAEDLDLAASITDKFICGIFPSELKIILQNLQPVGKLAIVWRFDN